LSKIVFMTIIIVRVVCCVEEHMRFLTGNYPVSLLPWSYDQDVSLELPKAWSSRH
jgi:hypothetical protein